ncbi:amidase family protein [Brevibacterium sp. 50QC2O2]|uniref:amidase family protein n=1 Tax=Brevibacterium sp. 50QC2O2 TaxID=2968459 RepID=UPI00211C8962|nr:amidase family protein [Brevibacterium sp. 50QC2O2]MCQ9388125.1 amidase family protein [Brevibacterium sp. 50QC2O2]
MHGHAPAHLSTEPDGRIWRVLADPAAPAAGTGPLDGLRLAVKDIIAVAGQQIGAGNPTWLAEAGVETVSNPAVAALLDAGARLRGVARTDEFAYSIAGRNEHYGAPPNGVASDRISGGSSSGCASAVALDQADIGLGTDTAGSIRVPASYQGLWGLRTTHGTVPQTGVLPLAQEFDTLGLLTRDPDTLEAAARILLSGTTGAGLPLLVARELVELCSPETQAAFAALLAAGVPVRETTLADHGIPHPIELQELFKTVQAGQAAENWHGWIEAHPGALGPTIAGRFAAALATPAADIAAARARLSGVRSAIRELSETGVLILPTAPGPAPLSSADEADLESDRTATLRLTCLAGLGGLPGLSVPALDPGDGDDPTPVGICLVGPRGSDLQLIERGRSLAALAR